MDHILKYEKLVSKIASKYSSYSSFEDLKQLDELGNHKLNVTIGSALDLFGGNLKYKDVLEYIA